MESLRHVHRPDTTAPHERQLLTPAVAPTQHGGSATFCRAEAATRAQTVRASSCEVQSRKANGGAPLPPARAGRRGREWGKEPGSRF